MKISENLSKFSNTFFWYVGLWTIIFLIDRHTFQIFSQRINDIATVSSVTLEK